ncbi:MAG TPA: terminase large subunit [Firmicutes bacterium]|nr:terminase large subunit [Bacillota bacterium]
MTDPVTQYAQEAVAGRVVVGLRVRQACERHLKDLERQGTDDFPYVFDQAKAERAFKFFGFCRHVKGMLAGKPIELQDWQKFIVGSIFGWVHRDTGLRRFRKAYVQVGRKNGKSTILSGIGLYMLMADGEWGAEVYATATKHDQARIVYDAARIMASRSPDLLKRLEPGKAETIHPATESKFMPLSKDTKSLDGLNPHLGIIDEYHAHQTSEMYDVIVSGMGQRSQPLLFVITTAGFDLASPCYEEYTYCCKLMDGILENEQYFAYIAQLDAEDSPQDESAWVKANPLLASTDEGMAYLRSELQAALDVPSKMRNFLTKNLNQWVDQKEDGYMPMEKWRACKGEIPDIRGRECYIGVDLSAKIDLTSVGFEFPLENGGFVVLSHSFMPEETVAQKRKTDKVPYDAWIRQGFITETPGAVVDYQFIRQYIKDQVAEHGWVVREVCVDPWNATQFAQDLQTDGFTVVEIIQGIRTLSEPTKHFREMALAGKIVHDGNPVLNWAMSNAVTRQDHNQNIMLDKQKARDRIDPVAALINAHVRAMLKQTRSVYEDGSATVWY